MANNKYINDIYEKFCNGDPLTDEELNIGYSHFRRAADLLIPLGPKFALAANEVIRVADGLDGYRTARKTK